ncbi:MAG TPA: hypothetical protein VMR41_03730 [Patescibacteria group bacterium]|nr:hypothetical protein [Patescibacteria group bacterium]
MARLKGSLNKKSNTRPVTSTLSLDERIRFLANLIIDKMLEDQRNGCVILKNKIQLK